MNENLLRGVNIRLRALEPADVDLLYEWENDTAIWKVSNTLTPFSRFQLEEYVMNAQQDIFVARQLRLIIDRIRPGEPDIPAGTIDLFDFDPFHLRAGIGILIREEFREQGFAREALQILIGYTFTTLRIHQLFCNISPDNSISMKLFGNLGFVRCGVKKDWLNEGGRWKEEWMFQLINQNE